ncbi:hypothetical protein EON62_06135 [archaeon]|nr:MAG: hypothetical protein EON62_06135 [archaeon]
MHSPPRRLLLSYERLQIFPDPTDPASTAANPCPGLAISDHLNRDGVVDGYQITTYASTDAYEKCIRRTYYYNTKGTNATLDFRPVGVELGGPLSRTQTFTSILYRMTVDGSDSCSTCAGASPAPSPAASTVPVATVTASVLVIPSSLPSFSNGAVSATPTLLALASVVLTAVLAVAL